MVSLQNPGADVSDLRPPWVPPENHYIGYFYDIDSLNHSGAPTDPPSRSGRRRLDQCARSEVFLPLRAMKIRAPFRTATLAFSISALGFGVTLAQEAPSGYVDRFPTVKDPVLHSALVRLVNLSQRDYFRPEVGRDAQSVLDRVADGALPVNGLPMSDVVTRIIERTVAAGRDEDLPVLRRLARHDNPEIRNALEWAQPSAAKHDKELLLELVLSAEALLPASLEDREVALKRLDEFSSRIHAFCTYVPADQRGPASQAVERFLNRYDEPAVREEYGPKFRRYLSPDFPHKGWPPMVKPAGNGKGDDGTGSPPEPAHQPTATGPAAGKPQGELQSSDHHFMVLPWLVGILSLVVLLWFAIKVRRT